MILNDDFKIKILSETDADLYKLVEHVDTTTESLNMKEKHEILILTEKRCQESVYSCKIMHVAAQLFLHNIELCHNWVSKEMKFFVCTDLYEYALNIVNLYRTLSVNT